METFDIEYGVGLCKSEQDDPDDFNLFINDDWVAAWDKKNLEHIFASKATESKFNVVMIRIAKHAYKMGEDAAKKKLCAALGIMAPVLDEALARKCNGQG